MYFVKVNNNLYTIIQLIIAKEIFNQSQSDPVGSPILSFLPVARLSVSFGCIWELLMMPRCLVGGFCCSCMRCLPARQSPCAKQSFRCRAMRRRQRCCWMTNWAAISICSLWEVRDIVGLVQCRVNRTKFAIALNGSVSLEHTAVSFRLTPANLFRFRKFCNLHTHFILF